MTLTTNFKQRLFEVCEKVLSDRVENAGHAMQEAQLAANGEEKSSAGDKFETARAMGQRDREMYARQYAEAKKEMQKVGLLSLEPTGLIKAGSLVRAKDTLYFIATGIGKVEIEGVAVMVISKESPIAGAMLGKSAGDKFSWNGNESEITAVL